MIGVVRDISELPSSPSGMWRYSKKVAACKLGRELTPETKMASGLILDVPDSTTTDMNFCGVSHPVHSVHYGT